MNQFFIGFYWIGFSFLFLSWSGAAEKSICDASDDREYSYDSRVGRTLTSKGWPNCSAFLVSPSCMISAGHCFDGKRVSEVEFLAYGAEDPSDLLKLPQPEKFKIHRRSITYNRGDGLLPELRSDWAVFRLKRNNQGEYAGHKFDSFEIDLSLPAPGSTLRVTGHGKVKDSVRNKLQQTHVGPYMGHSEKLIYYRVDTTKASSGAPVIDEQTGRVHGVHTRRGCYIKPHTKNAGQSFAANPEFVKAIQNCLKNDPGRGNLKKNEPGKREL